MFVLLIFSAIVSIKFSLNLFRLIGTVICYKNFLKSKKNLAQYTPLATSLFDSAGTNMLVHVQTLKTDEYQKFSNLLCDKSQKERMGFVFQQTIGTYKLRMLECINPFYWIFIPKYIFSSLGVSLPRPVSFFINIIYWILATTAAYLVEMYFDTHCLDFFHNIIGMLP